MTVCPHCKSTNNNSYYCRGCGRKLVRKSAASLHEENPKMDFIGEVIDIIEKNSDTTGIKNIVGCNTLEISLEEISKEEGILLIDGGQWKEIPQKRQNSCFFSETVFIYLLSAIITMSGYIAGANAFEMLCQLYASVFLLLSFLTWFLIPCFTGISPVSSVLYGCSMFMQTNKTVKNRASNLFTLFLFASVPSLFILPFLISMIRSAVSEKYRPVALSSSEIRYLAKVSSPNQ